MVKFVFQHLSETIIIEAHIQEEADDIFKLYKTYYPQGYKKPTTWEYHPKEYEDITINKSNFTEVKNG